MTPQVVVLPSDVEPGPDHAGFASADLPMVEAGLFRERPRLPSLHAGGRHRDPVDAAFSYRFVPPDVLETRASKELTRSRDMVDAGKIVVVAESGFHEWSPGDTNLGHLFELVEQERKVVCVE